MFVDAAIPYRNILDNPPDTNKSSPSSIATMSDSHWSPESSVDRTRIDRRPKERRQLAVTATTSRTSPAQDGDTSRSNDQPLLAAKSPTASATSERYKIGTASASNFPLRRTATSTLSSSEAAQPEILKIPACVDISDSSTASSSQYPPEWTRTPRFDDRISASRPSVAPSPVRHDWKPVAESLPRYLEPCAER